jgi:superfamily II DNA helicase RecQ
MRDQVKKLHDLGVSAVSLLSGIESDEEVKALEEGKYILYYMAQ